MNTIETNVTTMSVNGRGYNTTMCAFCMAYGIESEQRANEILNTALMSVCDYRAQCNDNPDELLNDANSIRSIQNLQLKLKFVVLFCDALFDEAVQMAME